MNPFVLIGGALLIDIIIFKILGFWLGMIGLVSVVYLVLKELGIIRSIIPSKCSFIEGVAFTKDYVGPYNENQKAFQDALDITKKFNLTNFSIIALYYDSPEKTEKNKLRASIGIYRSYYVSKEKVPDELERYCIENGYNKSILPNSMSLYSDWKFSNVFAMMQGIKKFYGMIGPNLKDPTFQRQFRFKEADIKVSIEVYEKDKICFYMPYMSVDKFLVFKKDK